MSDESLSAKDLLASITADLDQTQAMIDDTRRQTLDDPDFQKELDQDQRRLDEQRARVKTMKAIDDVFDP